MVNTNLQGNNNNNTGRFNLVLCELFNKNIHGGTNEPVDGHYLLLNKFDGTSGILINNEDDFEDDFELMTTITEFAEYFNEFYQVENYNLSKPHNILRNYDNIISRDEYIKPEIAECIILPTQHSVAIIKTIWIKLSQRKWKAVYAERVNIIKRRMLFSSLKTRELTGRWPSHCIHLPTIRGILHELK